MIHPKKFGFLFAFALVTVIAFSGNASAGVNMEIVHTLSMAHPPLNVVTTPDGKHICVLTSAGDVAVYDRNGILQNRIHVGDGAEKIKMDPDGTRLFVTSPEKKKVWFVDLDFFVTIETSGAPSKGAADAPIVLAVFSDFQ